MGNLNFDTEAQEAVNMDFEPIPKGIYKAKMVNSEVKLNSNGNGQILKAQFEVMDGEYQGRAVFTNFNIHHENADAQRIGRGQLTALCQAAGRSGIVDDSTDLHDLPVMIKVDIRPAKDGYKAQNEIKGYYKPDHLNTSQPGVKPAKKVEKKTEDNEVDDSEDDDDIPF